MRAAFWKVAGVLVVTLIGVEIFLWNTATAQDTQPTQRAVEPTPSTPRTAAVRKPAMPQQEIGVPTQYRERRKPQGNAASKISNTTSISGGSARTATYSGRPKTDLSAGSLGPISQMPHPRSVSDEAVAKPRTPAPIGASEGTPTASTGSATNVWVRGLGPISQPHPKSESAGTIAGANRRATANSPEGTAQRGENVGAMSLPHSSVDFTETLSDPSSVFQSSSTPSSVSQFQGYSANFVTGQIITRGQVVSTQDSGSLNGIQQVPNTARDINGLSQVMGAGWINSVTANPQMLNAAARGLEALPSSSLTTTQPTQSTQSSTPGTNSNTGPSGVRPGSEAAAGFGSLGHPSDMPASLNSPNSAPSERERSDQILNATGLRNMLLIRDTHDPSVSDNSEERSLPAGSDLKGGKPTAMGGDVVHGEDAQSAPESAIGSTSAARLSRSLAVAAAPRPPQNLGAQSSEIQAGTHYPPSASSSDVTESRGYTSPPTIDPTASASFGSVTTSPILFCLPFFPLLLLIYFGLRLS